MFRQSSRVLVLGLAASLAVAAPARADEPAEIVLDLSPFTPFAVGGEVAGVGTVEGEVISARLEATFVSNEPGPWSMAVSFTGFPVPGILGVSSVSEGWAGVGTFTADITSDALNGTLVKPGGAPFYSWFMSWSGGVPFELPGGVIGVAPMDGFFETLRLTLTLDPCGNTLPWPDLGGALAGVFGEPTFAGVGTLCDGDAIALQLTGAVPNGVSHLVIGLSTVDLPFKGGLLVPSVDQVVIGLPLDGAGALTLPFTWPAGVPSGSTFVLQHWIPDASGPAGFAASNALRGCVP